MDQNRAAPLAFVLVLLGGCALTPQPEGEERAQLVTGSNIPRKVRPGDPVEIYKPTPADMANLRTAPEQAPLPPGSR